jgi:hypothetical protein
MRIVQAFTQARRRLAQCAAQTPPGTAQPAAPPAPAKNTSGLVARILGKINPAANGKPPVGPPAGRLNPDEMQQLQQQVTQIRHGLRPSKLERDPQLADLAMGLVTQIETVTTQQCGAPKGPDLALLLLARQAEER